MYGLNQQYMEHQISPKMLIVYGMGSTDSRAWYTLQCLLPIGFALIYTPPTYFDTESTEEK
jgi:hypothetical protein